MRRVEADADWYLFDPLYAGELTECYGAEFSARYRALIARAEAGGLPARAFRRVSARDLYIKILAALMETGHPWLTFKDAANHRSMLKGAGVIHSGNLCVTGDTRLATQFGLVRVDDLWRMGVPVTATYDLRAAGDLQRYGVGTAPCLPVFCTAQQADVWEVRIREGYRVRATAWHDFFVLGDGKVVKKKLAELAVGDRLLVQSGEGQFGQDGSYELGLLMGLIAGDGVLSLVRGGRQLRAIVDLWGDQVGLADEVAACIALDDAPEYGHVAVGGWSGRSDLGTVAVQRTFQRRVPRARLVSARLGRVLAKRYGFTPASKLTVPEVVWRGTRDMVRGYLQGLFTADATVQVTENDGIPTFSIQLASKSRQFLEEIQILLTNFGIFSRIYRVPRTGGEFQYTTAHGIRRIYRSQHELWRLHLHGRSASRFVNAIGFLDTAKQRKCQEVAARRRELSVPDDGRKGETFTATICAIDYAGKEDVYDTTQLVNHSLIFNGLVTGNCTEIFLPTSPDEIAVCNLASVNLARHLKGNEVDWDRLGETVEVAVRGLDNVIDLNLYPSPRAARSTLANRPVGLGLMGFAQALARLGLAYDEPGAADLADRVVEFLSYRAILASHALARERGPFPNFGRSEWARGRVPPDTLADLEADRGLPVAVDRSGALDWEPVRAVARAGMRNGTVLAVAPTATISLIAGTSSSLDPYYSNVFSRQTLSGKFLEFHPVLVEELKGLGLWERAREALIENQGDVRAIGWLPAELRRRYPTAYQISPEAYLEVTARAQKWVDLGISRSLFFEAHRPAEIAEVYLDAWRRGLKATYYCFINPRMRAEPATVRVNKALRRPRWVLEAEAEACSLECEACQ
jgi:ribonucleotide reductase alpha subunit